MRSSGTMPMPAAMPSHGPRGAMVAPVDADACRRSRRRAPKIVSQNSERPEPISPARQTISPARTVSEAERTKRRRGDRPRASSTTSPSARAPRRSRARCTSRPTISRISSSGVGLGDLAGADQPAVLQHGHAVAEREDLGQPVRDVDDRHPVARQRAHDVEEPLGLGQRQRRGRLVEDQQPQVLRQRLGDLDHLRLRRRQLARPCGAGSIATPSSRDQRRAPAARISRAVDLPEPAASAAGRRRCSRRPRAAAPASLPGGRCRCRARRAAFSSIVAELVAVEPHRAGVAAHRPRRRSCRASTCRRRSRRAARGSRRARPSSDTSSSARTPGKRLGRARSTASRGGHASAAFSAREVLRLQRPDQPDHRLVAAASATPCRAPGRRRWRR